jgi:protein TonB
MNARALLARALHHALVALGAALATLAFFLVLPLLQVIVQRPTSDMLVRSLDAASLPPPPPPAPEEPPEDEPEPEAPPPELALERPLLDLAELELALTPALGSSWLGGDLSIGLDAALASQGVDELFSLAELDQEPRAIYQPSPLVDASVRRQAPGTAWVVFVVDERGRVVDPRVQRSTAPIFERPALAALQQWRFEPGKRKGRPVAFRMRVPITFPKD